MQSIKVKSKNHPKDTKNKEINLSNHGKSKKPLIITLGINTLFIILGLLMGSPEEVFGKEASFITWVSFAQLISISIISYRIFNRRILSITKKEAVIWALISAGFLFLSIDEVARIHENMDSFFHKKIIHMKETAITDRLDDLIIGIYALIGIGVLYKFKKELVIFKKALPYLITSILLIFLMVITEVTANRFDLLPFLIKDKAIAHNVYDLFKIAEEALKLYAEAVMVSGFYLCLQISKGITKQSN
jgi:DNA-binding CsgD family transcriptional regulator